MIFVVSERYSADVRQEGGWWRWSTMSTSHGTDLVAHMGRAEWDRTRNLDGDEYVSRHAGRPCHQGLKEA